MTREEAIKYLQWARPIKPYSLDKKRVQEAIDMSIKALSTRQAKWKRNETSLVYKCSNCKEERVMFPYPYCPMCGAEMVNSAKW